MRVFIGEGLDARKKIHGRVVFYQHSSVIVTQHRKDRSAAISTTTTTISKTGDWLRSAKGRLYLYPLLRNAPVPGQSKTTAQCPYARLCHPECSRMGLPNKERCEAAHQPNNKSPITNKNLTIHPQYLIIPPMKEQLQQLAPCVKKLHEITERICKEKIESFVWK